MRAMTALDLTAAVPRSPFDRLGGFPWLPRMIDKTRAFYAGTNGEYSPYPCPGDKNFLTHFGIDHVPLGELIKGGASDDAIAAWVAANAKRTDDAAKEAFHRGMIGPYSNPIMGLAVVLFRWKNRAAIRRNSPHVALGSLDTFAKMVSAEEGHPIPTA